MPEFGIANNDVLQVTIGQSFLNQRCLNVLHWQLTGGQSVTDGPAEIDRFHTAVMLGDFGLLAVLNDCQVTTCVVNFVRYQIVAPTRRRYIHKPVNFPGVVAGGAMPSNVSGVVTKQTDRVGRGRAGRFTIAGIPQSHVVNGAFTEGALVAMDDLGKELDNSWSIPATTLVWKPCVLSGDDNPVQPVVLGCVAQPTTRIIRRRTVGLGI